MNVKMASSIKHYLSIAIISLSLMVIFTIDIQVPLGITVPLLYPLILLAMRMVALNHGYFLTVGAIVVLTIAGGLLSPSGTIEIALVNRALLLVITIALGHTLRRNQMIETQLAALATTDPLTGVMNRRHFLELGERELSRIDRYKSGFCLLMIDIDHFKRINDAHGHPIGDSVIRALARSCAASLRPIDLFARYGGEEFIVAMPQTTGELALVAAQRLRKGLASERVPAPTGNLNFTVSIGLAEWTPADGNLQGLIARADKALYEAKEAGRDRVCVAALPPATTEPNNCVNHRGV